ncbi:CRISPR-associated helicase Cas3' [Nocardia camponoti]|uniref:CRISPR-associated helicase Cas3' n=1 Tax=Nocardia camponoti TaxID=1616106 RepID=UPI001E368209|nr:CRISPR-associated helicase Cas3' [Nocardia camponoti]
MAAPTGLGKTFAQGIFGLRHAARWGKSRVIVAVPFTTVTEQNAATYRDLLDTDDDPVVLEHHSSVRFDAEDDAQTPTQATRNDRWTRLAAENWDAPFVVTTNVQLFESLFGRKPSQIRKVHRLANSVLILDEVQALPPHLLLPMLSALRTLVEQFGTTVLLTSATQPEFQSLSVWKYGTDGGPLVIDEIIEDPQSLFERARRVTYDLRLTTRMAWPEVAHELAGKKQVLTIVNSIADARTLYQLLTGADIDTFHLSKRLAPAHRRAVLDRVITQLSAQLPAVVVATTLVEAGVDVSFPEVWRALGPADSIQQAGGRANRNGEIAEGGRVVVFDPVDGKRPREYEAACGLTSIHFGQGAAELDDQRVLARYYTELYAQLQLDHRPTNRRYWNAGQTIQHYRQKLDYRSVADGPLIDPGRGGKRNRKKAFRMIDDDSVPVVVPDEAHQPAIDAMVAQLSSGTVISAGTLRELQPWIVELPRIIAARTDVRAQITPVVGDLGVWHGSYDWDAQTCRGVGIDEGDFDSVL